MIRIQIKKLEAETSNMKSTSNQYGTIELLMFMGHVSYMITVEMKKLEADTRNINSI